MKTGKLANKIKEMILCGDMPPGERVTEAGLAERLGVSRTPVRNVIPKLATEGFLTPVGRRGYVVADFSDRDIFNALDLRALLEGWAARTLAERGASPETLAVLDECLAIGDGLLESHALTGDVKAQYGDMNARFHQCIIDACESQTVSMFVERLNHFPFVAPSVIVFDQVSPRSTYDLLNRAHGFHHSIVDAIRQRDGARAEMLFREHANQQRSSMFQRRLATSKH